MAELKLTGIIEFNDTIANYINILKKVTHFKYLSESNLIKIASKVSEIIFQPNHEIFRKGDISKDVYILIEGTAYRDYLNGRSGTVINKYSYFGERSCLFDEPRRCTVSTTCASRCLQLKGDDFIYLVLHELPFSTAVGRSLRVKQHIFDNFDAFLSYLFNSVSEKNLNFQKLLTLYIKMKPAIHPNVKTSKLETSAWVYAIKRLPMNICSTSTIVMSTKIIPILMDEMKKNNTGNVKTICRRRSTWNLGNGKIFILLRDAQTDVIDLMTCLCLHAVESRKLRNLLSKNPRNISLLYNAKEEFLNGVKETYEMQEKILSQIKELTPNDIKGLRNLWGEKTLENIWNVLYQHGDYNIIIDKPSDSFDDVSEIWIDKVRDATIKLLGNYNTDDLIVDIISSNTHSVVNLVSPWVHKRKDEILEWGRKEHPEIVEQNPVNDEDLLYIILQFYLKEFPDKAQERMDEEFENGILSLFEEELTGISVQLIDPSKLNIKYCDSYLNIQMNKLRQPKRHLIVNVDFAFGHQAEEVVHCLTLLYRKAIRSLNVVGKAGGLIGKRGDILLPSHVLLQSNDDLRPIAQTGISPEKIAKICSREVHVGTVLTCEGTLLQDRVLLNFYRKFSHCIGIEMEGSYFVRQIEQSIMRGTLNSSVSTRFLYYVSDIPLDLKSTLSKSLSPWEGNKLIT
ncbi:hypothetical protein BCR32DRAFT_64594 [Anaeromyces robustus]|uniref:Cyclic nucleotide-binding domain-containing protein n=1 Tax=Anaeromyces robustus TaxID=1754192 RepID=A0A1Y1WUS3_9FUNG|nr:hypothetical protein BCR32DRAFT_64594 [Anaeromyces robustus]|eukprot:ORX77155.1 hypothetical protein BCR32DRAFT_64594 [Anaeromyces robustus]